MTGKREPGNAATAETAGAVQAVPAFHLSLRWRNLMEYAIPAVVTGLLIVVGLEWLSTERMVVPYWGRSGALHTPTPSLGGSAPASTPVEISSYMSPTATGLARSGKNVIEGVKSAVGTGTASSDWRGGIGKLGSKLGAVTVTDSNLPGKGAPAITGVQNVIPDIRPSSNSVTLPSNANPGQQSPQEQVMTVRVPEDVLEKFLLVRVQPVYPAIARERGIAGAVVLRTTIARDGTVREVRAVSGNKYLAESALTAISQWRYKPFVLDGKPVQVATEIRVVFKRR
jgi:TonB family protein